MTTLPHIYIPSHGRATTISTHRLLGDIPHKIMVNTDAEARAYIAAAPQTGIDPKRVWATNQERTGQQVTRQYILNFAGPPGTWHVQMDDDLEHVFVVPDPWYDEEVLPVAEDKAFRARYATPASPERIRSLLMEWLWRAEEAGAHLVGPASNDNFYFRGKHWRTVGFVPGTFQMIKRDRLGFPTHNGIEDMYFTGLHLEAHGAVLIDNYAYPQAGHYVNPGGTMAYDGPWRVERRRRDYQDIMARFPGLWRWQDKAPPEEINLTMRLHSPQQIREWRSTMRARRAVGSSRYKEASR